MCRISTPGQAARTRATAAAGTTSPPVHTSASPAKHSGDSSASTRNSPAVTCTTFTAPRAPSPPITPASTSPAGATTTRPPRSSGIHSSIVEASNANGACASMAIPGPAATPSDGVQQRSRASTATPAWVTATPLGTPVDPEVYIT